MEEDRGETGGGRRGGRRDTEAEIGDGPASQTVSSLLVLNAFTLCHCFWMWPFVVRLLSADRQPRVSYDFWFELRPQNQFVRAP